MDSQPTGSDHDQSGWTSGGTTLSICAKWVSVVLRSPTPEWRWKVTQCGSSWQSLQDLAALTAGCAVDTKRATNLTPRRGNPQRHGALRRRQSRDGLVGAAQGAGASAWQLASAKGSSGARPRTTSYGSPKRSRSARRRPLRVPRGRRPGRPGRAHRRSSPTAFTTELFRPGLVASADHGRSAVAAGALGADLVRVEFEVGARRPRCAAAST